MGGGLLQLVAYGAQDIYLTGNPQMTFFKVVYRRNTNFAMESIEQLYSGTPQSKVTFIIDRKGDLIGPCYLQLKIKAKTNDFNGVKIGNRIGYQLIDYIEVEIGGQIIDTQYGDWMDIWSQISMSFEQYQKMLRLVNGNLIDSSSSPTGPGTRKVIIPLYFWFNTNPGLYLPLIALQYHEVKLNVYFKDISPLLTVKTP
jgi:hypothetical protein